MAVMDMIRSVYAGTNATPIAPMKNATAGAKKRRSVSTPMTPLPTAKTK